MIGPLRRKVRGAEFNHPSSVTTPRGCARLTYLRSSQAWSTPEGTQHPPRPIQFVMTPRRYRDQESDQDLLWELQPKRLAVLRIQEKRA